MYTASVYSSLLSAREETVDKGVTLTWRDLSVFATERNGSISKQLINNGKSYTTRLKFVHCKDALLIKNHVTSSERSCEAWRAYSYIRRKVNVN